jgi:hypothetical protein
MLGAPAWLARFQVAPREAARTRRAPELRVTPVRQALPWRAQAVRRQAAAPVAKLRAAEQAATLPAGVPGSGVQTAPKLSGLVRLAPIQIR